MYSSYEIKIHEINFWADVHKIFGSQKYFVCNFLYLLPFGGITVGISTLYAFLFIGGGSCK